jgi:phytoene dehydrogenase-like protein
MDPKDLPARVRRAGAQLQDPRLLRQAQHRARWPAAAFRRFRRARRARAATCTSPTPLEMMERAYDDWKEGRWSRAPYIDMLIPSQIDPTMAPDGKHYMSVFVQYCPYKLADGEWMPRSARPSAIRSSTPSRAQSELQGSHPARGDPHALGHRERSGPHRGQHLPGRADHGSAAVQPADPRLRAIPRAGARLYMCGSSTHPGGGVMGAPGANAARRAARSGERS